MNTKSNPQESLTRAVSNQSIMNYGTIIREFVDRGIPEDQILPRENVFTFAAWKALGRIVKKGQHGVKIVTWINMSKKDVDDGQVTTNSWKRPWNATVFHISQTEKIEEGNK